MATFIVSSPKHGIFEVNVDDTDLNEVSKYKWSIYIKKNRNTVYVIRHFNKPDGIKTRQPLHRFLMNVTDSEILVDHIDGNGLNNVRSNLRLANKYENQQNRKLTKNNKSGFKGVYWHKKANKFESHIRSNGQYFYIGIFDTAKEASDAYELKAKELFGEFYRFAEKDL